MLIIKTILSKCSSNENTLQTIFSNCNNLFCCTLWLSHAKPELLAPPPGHKGLLKLLLLMMLWSLILLQSFVVLLGILACLQESEILVLSHGVGYLHTVLIMGLLYVSAYPTIGHLQLSEEKRTTAWQMLAEGEMVRIGIDWAIVIPCTVFLQGCNTLQFLFQ